MVAGKHTELIASAWGLGEKSTNFIENGLPLEDLRHLFSVDEYRYELESPGKELKGVVRRMRAAYETAGGGCVAKL